jgi:hypothetical protein
MVSTQWVINGVHGDIKDRMLGHALDDMSLKEVQGSIPCAATRTLKKSGMRRVPAWGSCARRQSRE